MFDRSIDLVSPFCVQMNYEGLLDEVFGIETSQMSVPRKIIHPDDESKDGQKLVDNLTLKLNNKDSLFKRVRDCSLPGLGQVTKGLLREL